MIFKLIQYAKYKLIFGIYLFVFFTLFPHIGSAAQSDSTYIAPFRQEFSTGIYSYYQFTRLTHHIDDNNSTTYIPNSPLGFGLSVSYKKFGLSVGMGFKALRNPKFGKTRVIDWQYHYYGRKLILDFFLQNYKGFYSRGDDRTIILHPDITLAQYGLFGQYIFNNKKFSYRAAFNQSERQLRSAGSFQLGGGFYYNYVSSDTSLVINDKKKLKSYQLALSGGYVYTWVIERDYHIALGMSMGVNFGTENFNMKKIEVSPNIFPRISTGYNADSWSVRLSFVLNRIYVSRNENLNMLFNTGYAELSFTKRFEKSPKFLRQIKFLD